LEIASVSDANYEAENPIRYFESIFEKLVLKREINLGGFHFQIGGAETGQFPEQKMRLLLPPKREIETFLRNKFADFIAAVAREPERARSHSYRDPEIDISVTYDPAHRTFSGAGYPSYTALKAREKNSLYNALSRKASQLKDTGFDGMKGIAVCDAGASYLKDVLGGATAFSLRKIVGNFWRKHASISFVMIVSTVSLDGSLTKRAIQLAREIFLNGYLPWEGTRQAVLERILSNAVATMPKPIRLAINAWQPLSGRYLFLAGSFFGGGTLSSSHMKLSARTVQALLAGELSQEDFQNSHPEFVRILKQNLRDGRSIRKARVETPNHGDDDWLVFGFGEPDPAQAPFSKPNRPIAK
jgi:hypothetical protein